MINRLNGHSLFTFALVKYTIVPKAIALNPPNTMWKPVDTKMPTHIAIAKNIGSGNSGILYGKLVSLFFFATGTSLKPAK
jgi:hypothetical protein